MVFESERPRASDEKAISNMDSYTTTYPGFFIEPSLARCIAIAVAIIALVLLFTLPAILRNMGLKWQSIFCVLLLMATVAGAMALGRSAGHAEAQRHPYQGEVATRMGLHPAPGQESQDEDSPRYTWLNDKGEAFTQCQSKDEGQGNNMWKHSITCYSLGKAKVITKE